MSDVQTPPVAAALDLSTLHMLFEGDPEGLTAILSEVDRAIERGASLASGAANAQDWNEVRERAHELKGVCGNVGAHEAAASCANLERAAAEEPARVATVLPTFLVACTSVRLAIAQAI